MSRSCCAPVLRLAFISVLFCLPVTAHAQPSGPPALLPEGQTLISLSVTERRDVVPDRLVATLRVEREHRDPQELQQYMNDMMERVLERIGDPGDITVSTGRYAVYQHERQPQGGRSDVVWRGSQSVSLQTDEAYERVHELAGELQGMGLAMSQLNWALSSGLADETREALLESAIERARAQAERAGRVLGRGDVEVAEITVENDGGFSPGMMRSTAMDMAESSAPSSRPGETEVNLTISVRAVAR